MNLSIDIDVANLAVACLKCMLENWDKLASASLYIDLDTYVKISDSNEYSFTVIVTRGLCDVFDNIGIDYWDYIELYRTWDDVFTRDNSHSSLIYPVGGSTEYESASNLYANPKRKALAEWCLQCLEEYVEEHAH